MTKTSMAMGLVTALVAAAAFAAPGGGYGPGYGGGGGPGSGACATAGAGGCNGAGYGPGRGRMGGFGAGAHGASLMTDAERAEHRDRMHSFTSVEQCTTYWTEHRAEMQARMKAQGIEPGPGPRQSPCERMAARGLLAP